MVAIQNFDHLEEFRKPRRVMKYLLIYCCGGGLEMTVDENRFQLAAGDALTITSGQAHYINATKKAAGYALEFTLDFFCKDDKDIELIFHNGLFCHFGINEIIPVDKKVMEPQLTAIRRELEEKPYQYLISIHSRIELILVSINRAKVERNDEIWKPDALFLKFLEAVRNNFAKSYPLSEYARILTTTEIKLNELAKLHAGKTAQSVIYGLIVSEAKRLLTYENITVKEAAYKLGFEDPFYFSNFFKRHTKTSPKQYQIQHALK